MKVILLKKMVAAAAAVVTATGISQHLKSPEKATAKVQQTVNDMTDKLKNAATEINTIPSPYESEFDITDTVNYALEWCDKGFNPEFEANEWLRKGAHCASFVSECLMAGGLKLTEVSRDCNGIEAFGKCFLSGYDYANVEWSGANDQFIYLKRIGYECEKASDNAIHVGDVVYYDYTSDKDSDINHAAICIGSDSNGKPIVAEHSTSTPVRVWDKTVNRTIATAYVVHTTKTTGLRDITREYSAENVSLNALKAENAGFFMLAKHIMFLPLRSITLYIRTSAVITIESAASFQI